MYSKKLQQDDKHKLPKLHDNEQPLKKRGF
jgi:hypothetical protein